MAVIKALVARNVLLREYLCQYCEGWHLTSSRPKQYKERKEAFSKLNQEIKAQEMVQGTDRGHNRLI